MTQPEDFWIGLGDNLMGLDVLRDGVQARQYLTYQAIVEFILHENIQSVLDIGCNYAPLETFLREAGYRAEYLGIDSNPYAVNYARRQGMRVKQGNLRDLWTWPYECVVVKDVIEHLESCRLLARAFELATRFLLVATFIPWSDAPQQIIWDANGYYMNRYNRADVYAFAQVQGFGVYTVQRIQERNGADNEMVGFERRALLT